MEKQGTSSKKLSELRRKLQPWIDMLKDTNRQIILELKKIEQRWKEHTEILYNVDVNFQDVLEDVL